MISRLFSILVLAGTVAACGTQNHKPRTSLKAIAGQSQPSVDFSLDDNETYQIGTEMGKIPVTPEILADASAAFQRAARATARTSNATAFYVGFYNGYHVAASNHHVFPAKEDCLGQNLRFVYLDDRRFPCETFFGSWPEIDLSLFAIFVDSDEDAQALASVAGNFAFGDDIKQAQDLLTIGFGTANNPGRREMMANQDSDCKVFSEDGDYRLLADPDELNPGPYKAWSVAIGCDVSHGDSGSAIVDRQTSKVVGIIWTGKIPKNERVREPGYTDRILAENSPDIWTELSLAVPAPKIGEFLGDIAKKRDTPNETIKTIEALLAE